MLKNQSESFPLWNRGEMEVGGMALAPLAANLLVGAASLAGLRDSWRFGVLEDQQTDLIEGGKISHEHPSFCFL